MSGVYHLEIPESEEVLKALLREQKSATDRDRVHLLYLLKSGQVETMQEAATWLGRHRVTAQKWAKRHRYGGLSHLLAHAPHTGDKSTLPEWAETALRKRLEQSEGFESYAAIHDWLATHLGIVAPYKTVHKWVYYRLGAAPKVVRPKSNQQDEAALAAYKKTG
ncbi:MAG: transposase [Leptolyngbyaceae cyanobacterium]